MGFIGLNLAGILANHKNQVSREWIRTRWKESSQEVGEGRIRHSRQDSDSLLSYESKGKVRLPRGTQFWAEEIKYAKSAKQGEKKV